ncbi:hypothetical protein [Mycoplasma sp. SG1]|uniref:hypothetical protein n=1 Tax=Mycoplasma sp. SG1 TaxID=2810348 RepID=UPI00202480F1|nr:hypothetical protein [Mycoplasma sp. SG1]URM53032.1 hypothetical protein JRW51_01655 [Mycoplasma sp. SG1]
MINFKKTSKYILTTGGLALASLGIFAGCGSSGGVDKASIQKTVNDLFKNGIAKPKDKYNGSAVKNPNFNVKKDDSDAINALVTKGTKTNNDSINLSVTSVIADSVVALDDGSNIIQATLLIHDEDIKAPTADDFKPGTAGKENTYNNPANNFIYTIGYFTDKDGNITDFAQVGNDFLHTVEFAGDGLSTTGPSGEAITLNDDFDATGGDFDPSKTNTNLKSIPLFDNRFVVKKPPVIDNGPGSLLGLGNAFYLAVKTSTNPGLWTLADSIGNKPKGDDITNKFSFGIGYTDGLNVSVNKLDNGNGYNWSLTSNQLSFSKFDIEYFNKGAPLSFAPIVSTTQVKTPTPIPAGEKNPPLTVNLGFYGKVDFQYSIKGNNGNSYIGYSVSNLGLFK